MTSSPWFSAFRLIALVSCSIAAWASVADEVIHIGDRRELFVDDFLIQRLSGDAKQVLQIPAPQNVVFKADAPWEGNTSAYFTLFADGDGFRMYYRGSGYDLKTEESLHPEYTCMALSTDGVQWTRPELNLFEFNGSKANNIVWFGTAKCNVDTLQSTATRTGGQCMPCRQRRSQRFTQALLVVGFVLSLPVMIPAGLAFAAIHEQRLKFIACTTNCTACGAVLGKDSLRLAEVAWTDRMKKLHEAHPGVRFRAIRDLHAICPTCGQRYHYREKDNALVTLEA